MLLCSTELEYWRLIFGSCVHSHATEVVIVEHAVSHHINWVKMRLWFNKNLHKTIRFNQRRNLSNFHIDRQQQHQNRKIFIRFYSSVPILLCSLWKHFVDLEYYWWMVIKDKCCALVWKTTNDHLPYAVSLPLFSQENKANLNVGFNWKKEKSMGLMRSYSFAFLNQLKIRFNLFRCLVSKSFNYFYIYFNEYQEMYSSSFEIYCQTIVILVIQKLNLSIIWFDFKSHPGLYQKKKNPQHIAIIETFSKPESIFKRHLS